MLQDAQRVIAKGTLLAPQGLRPAKPRYADLPIYQGEHLRGALELRAVICLLDCRLVLQDSQMLARETMQDQVNRERTRG